MVIWHWNCNGIKSELNEFKYVLSKKPRPNVICLQETHLKPNTNISFDSTGYKIIRRDRLNEQKGGLLIMIDPNIPYVQIDNPSTIEHQVIKINFNNDTYHVINIYDRNLHLDQQQYNLLLNYPNSLIMGDFNAHHKLWGHSHSNKKGIELLEVINDKDLVLHNDKSPTHIYRQGTNALDLTFTSYNIAHQFTWENTQHFLGSDHCIIKLHKSFQIRKSQPIQNQNHRFNLKKANWIIFTEMAKQQINESLITENPVESYEKFEKQLLEIAKKAIPYYSSTQKRCNNWWNQNCEQAVKERNKARNKAQRTRNLHDIIEFKRAQAVVKLTIKQAKQDKWEQMCSDTNNNIHKLWNTVNKLKGKYRKKNISTLFDENKQIYVTENKEKSELLVNHFAHINSNDNFTHDFLRNKNSFEAAHQNEINDLSNNDNPINQPFTLTELKNAIVHKKDSTPGPDNIHYAFYKHLPSKSLQVILEIFNKIWKSSQLPPSWKHSNVIAILKQSKPPHLPTSYRPISLTSNSCKIFETLINNRLKWYLEKNNIINVKQSGFRNHHSTVDHLITLTDHINKAIVTKKTVNAIFLDITKAFDMVWHIGLLYKIKRIGLQGNIYGWIKSFLENRTISVKIDNHLSKKMQILNGVPQGSVLSPTLFNIFINDIPISINNTSLFADDIAIWVTGKQTTKLQIMLQDKLNKINKWSQNWGINFSSQKSVSIQFNNLQHSDDLNYSINNQPIPQKTQHKFLGLIFDKKLTWSHHFNYIREKSQKYINLMKYIGGTNWGANKKTLLTIYNSHIKPLLTYGSPAIIQSSNFHRKTLELVQNMALRIATRSKTNTSTAALQVHTGIPPLKLHLLQNSLKYYVKALTHQLPSANNFELSWQSTYKKINRELISETIADYKKNYSLPITPKSPSEAPPWQITSPEINTQLTDKVSKENPALNRTLVKELIQNYNTFTEIYTDGSKIKEKVGFGIFSQKLNINQSVRINNNTSIFTAEATAIITAIHIVIDLHINKALILSDSLSVIQSLHKSNNSYAQNIRQLFDTLNRNEQKIILIWIPSHCGIQGNEQADKLAKLSLNNTEVQNISLDIQEHNTNITKYITNKWQSAWNSYHNTLYKQIQPSVKLKCHMYTQNIYAESLLTSFMLDNPPLKLYQSKINKDISPNCSTCNMPETSHHYFFQCIKYINQRQPLISKLNQLKVTHNLVNILNNKDIIPTTINYIKTTNRFTKSHT